MPCIKPVSDLRNYNAVLENVSDNNPVFLTKNGRGTFAIITINEYEKLNEHVSKNIPELLNMSTEEFNAKIEKGYQSMLNNQGFDVKTAFEKIKRV